MSETLKLIMENKRASLWLLVLFPVYIVLNLLDRLLGELSHDANEAYWKYEAWMTEKIRQRLKGGGK